MNASPTGFIAAPVADLEDMVVRDPWLSKQHLVAVPFEEAGIEFRTHNEPARMDGRVPAIKRSPRFGEHSEQVLRELLGISEQQYQQLLIDEVVY